jgi:sugar phosphate isomerase/epimerase
MRLAIQTLLLPGQTLDEKFANAARFGFDAVEVAIGPDFDLRQNLPAIQKASKSSSLPVSDICTHPIHDPFVPDADERQRRLVGLTELMSMADDLQASGVICVPVRPPHEFAANTWEERYGRVKKLVVESLKDWLARLPQGKSALFLEPLNRYETYFLNRVEQALEICREVDQPRLKVMADFFHMNIEEANFSDPFLQAGKLLGMVHIADNNRLQPGRGCLDFRPGFTALKAIGYQGYISIECWSPTGAVIDGDPEIALPETVHYLRQIWDSA